MQTLDSVDAKSLKSDIPNFRPGDTVKVHVKVVEGNRSRIQVFQGVVIRRQGGGVRAPGLGQQRGAVGGRLSGDGSGDVPHRRGAELAGQFT